MKQFILLALVVMLFGCERPQEIYETDIKTYVISSKDINFIGDPTYIIYFQSSTCTERTIVSEETYNQYQIGDTIQVLIKYWEKPKNK